MRISEKLLATIVQFVETSLDSFSSLSPSHCVSLMSGAKSSSLAYLFALFGGVFGIHHLYLGRTKHALLWLTTFGGFGLGILDEIFYRLNKYVKEVNLEDSAIEQYEEKIQQVKSPAFELKRFFGKISSLSIVIDFPLE